MRGDRFWHLVANPVCKNHHWAFDRGWFGISDRYRIVVPPDRVHEDALENTRSLRAFDGEAILLPDQEGYRPRLDALVWHRSFWKIA
ncbi:hypothetical protein ACKFKG_00545 [Phormidesmis sp. 146-35]